ncbi:MAG: hypothetical protein AAGG72_07580, partial [Pseudomonadota bacterium]
EIIPADFPMDIGFTYFVSVSELVEFLYVHAVLSLAKGQPEPAVRDIETMLRFTDTQTTSSFLITVIATYQFIRQSLDAIWHGLENHAFDKDQLIRLQNALGPINLIERFHEGIQGEMVTAHIATVDAVRDNRRKLSKVLEYVRSVCGNRLHYDYLISSFFRLQHAPDGWYDQHKAKILPFYQDHCLPAIDTEARRVHLAKAQQHDVLANQRITSSPFLPFFALFYEGLLRSLRSTAQTQTEVDFTILALGLERYRQANDGEYPETLDALSPDFLPTGWTIPPDILTGNPLHYLRVPEKSTYLLYASGFNQADDGGTLYIDPTHAPPHLDRESTEKYGDWVWPTPAMSIKPTP